MRFGRSFVCSRKALLGATLLLCPGLLLPVGSLASVPPGGDVVIRVLSNRADLVSGGDALVEMVLPERSDPARLRVDVAGRDISSRFAARPNGHVEGLVTGLPLGPSVLTTRLPDGRGASILITNHAITGPVLAGPQVQPWNCATTANGLGPPTDAACDTPAVDSYMYMPAGAGAAGYFTYPYVGAGPDTALQPYDPGNPPNPALVATTTTDAGVTVPYIVRVETGVIDRGVYQIAVLFDPGKAWQPWTPQRQWNQKLLWRFGGDCKPWHDQAGTNGGGGGGVFDDYALSRGYAVAASDLTVLGQDCNSVVSAEAVMMVKEHFIETYGPVRYTISNGGSGGSMQQHWIASDYPGLLDGIQPIASFPDIWETMQEAEDCALLGRYFTRTSPQYWAAVAQQDAVTGYGGPVTCTYWATPGTANSPMSGGYARTWLDPANAAGCTAQSNPRWVYDPRANPRGVRCTLQDYMVAVYGRRASDGFANRPYDNAGVQYGLTALGSGLITAEQFVDMNLHVGGFDIDRTWQPQRSQADPAALEVAYRAGLVTEPREAASVPIIDLRGAYDPEIHTDFHSYTMRARLQQVNGTAANQVIWTGLPPLVSDPRSAVDALGLMDRWLAAIAGDRTADPPAVKVLRNKPADAVDACWIGGHEITDASTCRAAFPYFADPRIAAGGPLADDILKCRLKPLERADYGVAFTSDQWTRMQQAFPTGVCRWNQPGVGQQASIPWLSFVDGPGGRPLGNAPASAAFGATRGARAAGGTSGIPDTGRVEPATGARSVVAATLCGVWYVLRRRSQVSA